jgi:uncharacterized protein YkwD
MQQLQKSAVFRLILVVVVLAAVWPAYAQTGTPLPNPSLASSPSSASPQRAAPAYAEQLFALANQARETAYLHRLTWDPALAAAALAHARRMAAEGPIAHRYDGEPDLTERAGEAGAHFSRIEENIAVGSYPATIHQGWMDSPGHRANLLNAEIDRIGVAVVAAQGVIFAVADYARSVPVLTPVEVESTIAALVRNAGLTVLRDPSDARAACVLDHGLPASRSSTLQPLYVMRWQGAELDLLPQALMEQIATRRYRQAAVGNCAPAGMTERFTAYRLAVLLY